MVMHKKYQQHLHC